VIGSRPALSFWNSPTRATRFLITRCGATADGDTLEDNGAFTLTAAATVRRTLSVVRTVCAFRDGATATTAAPVARLAPNTERPF
jgi:hypothetical protein